MLNKNRTALIWLLIGIGLISCSLILFAVGCQHPDIAPLIPTTPKQTLVETVLKTDWIITASIFGVALSVMAWMNGSKTAIGVMAGCGVAIWMQLTVVRYAHVLAWVGLVFAVGITLWTMFVKNKALKEIVTNVQTFKDKNPRSKNYLHIQDYLCKQTKTTQKIVSQIKGKLPGKRV